MLNRCLFVIVLEALSREIRPGSPEELLYPSDLAMFSETIAGLERTLSTWKWKLESKGATVNLKKIKMISENVWLQKNEVTLEDEFCCRKSVGSYSILHQFHRL